MNAFTRQMQAQGSERFLRANGRRFVISYQDKRRVLSEVLAEVDGTVESFTGFWRGQPKIGFHTLDTAGNYRRLAMRERDAFRRRVFIRRCREAIADSIAYRMTAEQVERCRQIYSEAA